MKRFVILLGLFIIPQSFARHTVHLSVVNLEFDKQTQNINYTIRIFQEDYIYLLNLIFDEALHNASSKNPVVFDSVLISHYFEKAFVISFKNKILRPQFIRQQSDETDVRLSFSTSTGCTPDTLILTNKIMLDLFTDQTNLVIFYTGNEEKGLTFDAQNTAQAISLK